MSTCIVVHFCEFPYVYSDLYDPLAFCHILHIHIFQQWFFCGWDCATCCVSLHDAFFPNLSQISLGRWSTHVVVLLLYDFAYELSNGLPWEIFCHRCYIWSHFLSSEQMLHAPKARLFSLLCVNNSHNWRANPHGQLFCELPRSPFEWTFFHTLHTYGWFPHERFLCVFSSRALFW